MTRKIKKLITKNMEGFEEELASLKRRAERLRAAIDGTATVRKIWRKGYKVRAHAVRGHHMLLLRTKAA